MPYAITWETDGLLWTYRGVVTGAELLRSNQEIYGDPRFDEIAWQIVDLSGVERLEANADDMAVIAANDLAAGRSNPYIRVAVVVRDEAGRKISAQYEAAIAGSPWRQRIFESIEAALAWARQPRVPLRGGPGK